MEALFEIIRNQMEKHRVEVYHMHPILLTVDPLKDITIDINNDFYFFVNAFSGAGTINGRISGIGGGNGLDLNPLTSNMAIVKYQMFKGRLYLQNFDSINTLYVEVLRITPIPKDKPDNICNDDLKNNE